MENGRIVKEIQGLYRIMAMNVLRRTPGVCFDTVPLDLIHRIDAVDRVIHDKGARSPGPVDQVTAPWYTHPQQDDNLVVLHGTRQVELYTRNYGKIEVFSLEANRIEQGGKVLFEGPVMLGWPRRVFHRIKSDEQIGSASVNFAVHYEGFDIRTNFNIYDLNVETGSARIIRQGHLDQPS
jgi:hypothetical protein